MSPEHLAELVHQALIRRRRQLAPGAINQLLAVAGRIAPALVEQIMRRTLFDRLHKPTSDISAGLQIVPDEETQIV